MLSKVKRVSSITPKLLKDLGRVQRRGGVAMLIDCTGALDRMGASGLSRYGVDPSALLVSSPDNARQAREIETRVRYYVEKMAVAGCARHR
jgi:RecA/RadA recombinase